MWTGHKMKVQESEWKHILEGSIARGSEASFTTPTVLNRILRSTFSCQFLPNLALAQMDFWFTYSKVVLFLIGY